MTLLAVTAAVLVYGLIDAFALGPVTDPDFLHAWGLRGIYEFAERSMAFRGDEVSPEVADRDSGEWLP